MVLERLSKPYTEEDDRGSVIARFLVKKKRLRGSTQLVVLFIIE